jgi:tetratricopeptide (TPR) repeat protein
MKTICCFIFIYTSIYCNISFCQDARDYYESGISKIKLQDNKSAFDDFTKAIELDSTFINAYVNRAELKEDFQDIQGAIDDYTKVIMIDKSYKDAYYKRGILFYKMGSSDKACKDWEKARELGSKPAKNIIKKYCEN